MPWPVYSTRFLSRAGHGGFDTYTVPAGYRAVIRELSVVATSITSSWAQAIVNGWTVYIAVLQDPNRHYYYAVRWTVYAGETMQIGAESPGVSLHLNGFLFQDPPGQLEQPAQPAGPEPQLPYPPSADWPR